VERADAGTELALSHLAKAESDVALPKDILLQIVDCPDCHREMDRARFAQRASLVVDICLVHGMWLDAGELVSLLTFVKDRGAGVAVPGAIEREDQEKWDRISVERAEEERMLNAYAALVEKAERDRSRYG
jgi:Zn-finger nucleic acid-binding protein